jgi:hypothetical protein
MSATETPVAEPASVERRRMSYEEYKHWEHEGGLTEWVDGEVHIYIPPKMAFFDLPYCLASGCA